MMHNRILVADVIQIEYLEKYSRGWRGAPAKGVNAARGFKSLFLRLATNKVCEEVSDKVLPFYVLYKILIKDELKSKLEFNMYISIRKKTYFCYWQTT